MKLIRSMCALFALIVVFRASVPAQAVNGTLLGNVTDTSGGTIADAKIDITEINTGVNRSTQTNGSGNFIFSDLPPGTYTVTAAQMGFRRESRAKVDVLVDSAVRVDLMLQPGSLTETVNVTAETPMLQTDRSDTGRKIEAKQIEDLPIGGARNFQSLLALVPGSTRPAGQHSAFFNPQQSLGAEVNGQSRMGNNYQLEGVDDNERTGLLQVLIPPAEAIQTVDVSTSNFEAELGRATGAATNVIFKSGTNQFHGSAYEFNRVSALAARGFYDPSKGHFTYNYFGGTIGGPIKRNRTFFFGDYLRIEDHSSNIDRLTVPTAEERGGNLNIAAPGQSPTPIYDPFTGNLNNGQGRTQFRGNMIPANRINALSAKILSNIIPLPNLPGLTQNYFSLSPFYRNTDQFDVKVDHNQTDNDRLSIRYSFSRPVTFDSAVYGVYGGPRGVGGAGFEANGVQNTHSGAINYDHIFSPTLIVETRFGVSRYRNDAQQIGYGQDVSTQLGVPGVNVNAFTSGPVGINLNNFGDPFIGFAASLPWIRAESNVNFVNTWTKTKGNHTVKWGIDLRRIRDDLLQTQTFSPRGRYTFGTSQTSISGAKTSFTNSLASFLLDVPSEVGRDLPVIFPAYRAWEFFTFAQDKWTVTPKLTLDLGLRWELYPPGTPAHAAGFSNYDPTTNSLVIAGVGGNPSNLGMQTNYHDFAPRFGIAYRLNEKTVFRGGFGISYSPFPDNTYAYNFPVKQNNAYEPNCGFCPAVLPSGQIATFQAGFPPPTPATIPSNGIIANADVNQSYIVINKNFREPYVESWNVALQRSLPWNLVFEAAYVGNHGVDQPVEYNLNAGLVLGAGPAGQPEFTQFGRKAATAERFLGVSSSYNSLQAKLDKRFSAGLSLTTAYTFSKAMTFNDVSGSGVGAFTFYINPHRNYARANFDRTHSFVQSWVYELPFGKGKRWLPQGIGSRLLGGWQTNAILSIYSGNPLNFAGDTGTLNAPFNGNTLNHFGPIQVTKGNGRDATWFNAAKCGATVAEGCFSQPVGGFGNLGLNVISGPGFWNLDASVFRNFHVTERSLLQFRAEGFSVVNTPQWNNPDTGFNSATFGYITGAGGARRIQFAAKFSF